MVLRQEPDRHVQQSETGIHGEHRAQLLRSALALEQLFLTLIALAAGTAIAVLTATLYIPHLPASIGTHPGVPPYLVEIAWGEMLSLYIAFGVVLLVGVGFATISLGQMKIFQTVKLGESV